MIDTHCHVNFEAFDKDYQKVVARTVEKGMKLIAVGSQLATSRKAVEIAGEYENVFAAVGLHPTHLTDEDFSREEFLKLAEGVKTVAIGETGLDYYQLWADTPEEESEIKNGQKELLKKHLDLAKEVGKPVILHCRDAYEDLIRFMKEQEKIPAVVHCFLGSRKIAREFLELGCFLGFTGIITFTDDQELIEAVKEIPLEKIFIETDAPYLSPEPFRGKRCEPVYVEEVAKKIAEIKNISLEKVIKQTDENAEKFFKI